MTPDAQEAGSLILPLLDTFTVEGPNGKHLCYVTEAAACSLSDSKGGGQGGLFRLEVARVQTTCAVGFLYSRGLIHGDLHLGNLLLSLPHGLNELSTEDLYSKYDAPQYDMVSRIDGLPLSLGVPTRLSQPVWTGQSCTDLKFPDAHILLVDFGASFFPHNESRFHCHAPTIVRPPEARFQTAIPITYSSDIWTLGCSIWNMLAWRSPFESFFGDEDETTFEQVDALGPLPPAWWEKWEARNEFFTDQGTPTKGRSAWPLEQRFEEGVQELRQKEGWPTVSSEEKTAFLAMIRSMFSYAPEDRPSIQQVLKSDWMQRWALPEYQKLEAGRNEY